MAYALLLIPAQADQNIYVNGILFIMLAGAALFAVCRSSYRN